MSISAMKQALDVIETYSPEYMHGLPKKHYTKALHQAIAEAEKREWVGLTEEEAWKCWDWEDFQSTWKSIEAKLKEKNT